LVDRRHNFLSPDKLKGRRNHSTARFSVILRPSDNAKRPTPLSNQGLGAVRSGPRAGDIGSPKRSFYRTALLMEGLHLLAGELCQHTKKIATVCERGFATSP
jgi:hypothetical protein